MRNSITRFVPKRRMPDAGYWMLDGGGTRRMPRRSVVAIAIALGWATLALQAQAPAKKMSYDNFPKVQTRNIFDPDRARDLVLVRPSSHAGDARPQSTPPPVAVKPSDYVELTGVMTTEAETFAFFAGSQPEYNKVLPLNGTIAGATITKITPSSIDVSRNGKSITVAVGMTVPFDDSAPGLPPTVAQGVDPQAASAQVPLPDLTTGTSGTSATTTTSPPPAAAPADNISDAMRRMIERRQKELNQ